MVSLAYGEVEDQKFNWNGIKPPTSVPGISGSSTLELQSVSKWCWRAMIDVGLVGFGFAGRTFHAPVISAVEGLRLAAVRAAPRATKRRRLTLTATIVRSLDDLLAISSIRLVVIATPNTSHFELAKQCLLAGRDVVIDKPFAPTYAEAADWSPLQNEKQRLLSVYQNRRWDGDFQTLQRLHEGRQVWTRCAVRVTLRPFPPATEGERLARARRTRQRRAVRPRPPPH